VRGKKGWFPNFHEHLSSAKEHVPTNSAARARAKGFIFATSNVRVERRAASNTN
jgi:hypothetical protein